MDLVDFFLDVVVLTSKQQHVEKKSTCKALLENTWDYQVHESKLYTRACMTIEEASDETETVSLARVCIKNMCKRNTAPDQMFCYYLLLLIFKIREAILSVTQ